MKKNNKKINPVRTGTSRPVNGGITLPSIISIPTTDRGRRHSNGVKKFLTPVLLFAVAAAFFIIAPNHLHAYLDEADISAGASTIPAPSIHCDEFGCTQINDGLGQRLNVSGAQADQMKQMEMAQAAADQADGLSDKDNNVTNTTGACDTLAFLFQFAFCI